MLYTYLLCNPAILLVYRVRKSSLRTLSSFSIQFQGCTLLCTGVFTRVADHYINRGSHAFVCFLDFSTAFDKVNYWKLPNKLIDDNIDGNIVRVLAYWFSKQYVSVRWHSALSQLFSVGNGTRRGGVLSPYFLNRYTRDMLSELNSESA
jgi:Reverse transcriptase (RNA-dependent DNA polymerase)